jgi:MFS family permease
MDVSSEMIHGLLPMFLVSTFGAAALTIGVIEGIAEATASILKVFAGALSDRLGRRKPLLVLGYGLAALSKPLFPLATGLGAVLFARFVDRVGKGLRGAPRDAFIADVTPEPLRATAYGLRQALDTVGAVLGPGLAIVLMVALANDYRAVFWVATIPAMLCVLLVIVGVREAVSPQATKRPWPLTRAHLRRLPHPFYGALALAVLATFARPPEAFLILRGVETGLDAHVAPAVMLVMNVAYAAVAYPLGRIADDGRTRALLIAAFVLLALGTGVLGFLPGHAGLWTGAVLWGLHMGASQGLFATLIARACPPDLRGTGFGLYHLAVGLGTLVSGTLAGLLWSRFGAEVAFGAQTVCAAIGFAALLLGALRETASPASP